MLSLHPQDINNSCYLPHRTLGAHSIPADRPSFMSTFNMGGAIQTPPTPQQDLAPLSPRSSSAPVSHEQPTEDDIEYTTQAADDDYFCSTSSQRRPTTLNPPADYNNLDANTVAEALEIARDSPDGARDPVVSGILESALSQIWARVTSGPDSYVMTPGEFAVFNFYQHRFLGNKIAVAARARYWNNTHA